MFLHIKNQGFASFALAILSNWGVVSESVSLKLISFHKLSIYWSLRNSVGM